MRLNLDDPLPPEDWVGTRTPRADLEALYRTEAPRLSRFFSRRVAADEVLDMVHETFRRLLGITAEQKAQLDSPEAYLSRVADNLMRDRARSLSHRAATNSVPIEEESIAGPDPHRHLESRDAVARVDAALLTLKPKTRAIFVMHRIDGLSYAEIGRAKGISVGAVEKHIAKALTLLRRQLRDR